MGKLGIQLYSIKEEAERDFLGVLDKISGMGYEGAQFAGFFGHTAQEVKAKMDEVGIKAAGAHVPIEDFQGGLDDLLSYHDIIDNRLLICPWLSEDMRTTADDYKRTAELFNKVGEKVAKEGFSFGYHNHAFEFDLFDGKSGFDILYENTDPEYVKMELDCFWAVHAGYEPAEIIKKYADRCISLHIKDLKLVEGNPVSTELGAGTIDIGQLIKAGNEHKVDWFVVEQEDFIGDPVESVAQNAKALKRIIESV
ncbi:sugar phosphate isomerase/epimerase family protein [Sporosarcina sp. G11-34]|uniref:sugar phosphate isomerase/epimerase family protein n=1 Tax=Sporosarcina sp. G11-34 TaxID=2849605 RepID=UPI0022A9778A|nr:sugar phosphate isomerase/epimerase [Sporosarcina sp. G11-34]MCZ2258494.1 sugar phosphate isomerase/epimerase [Sporosarcina sp. G11-34]